MAPPFRTMTSHYGANRRREQEPSTPSIEQVFAKLKHLLRKAAARTCEEVCTAIGALLGTYTAEECANYLDNSGYGQT